jgi:Ser/Thr protein kinase RdoA (MazF antagonist)
MNGFVPRMPRPSRVTALVASRFGQPLIEPATVREVLQRYDLEPLAAPRNLRLGRRSLNAAVTTRRGPKVLKLYRPQWNRSTVAYGHSILLELAACGFPAVRLYPTSTGATAVTIGDRVFALFDFVPGVNYSLNYLLRSDRLRLTRIAARTLAAFHRRLEHFVPAGGDHHLGLASPSGPRRRDMAWHEAKVGELRARADEIENPEAACLARTLDCTAEAVLDELDRLDAVLSSACLHRLVIHGDYGLHNLIYRADEAIPVDFEVSRLDYRVNELVSVLGKHRYRGGRYDLESMHTFMTAYADDFPLTPDERSLFPEVWRSYKLQAAVQYWNSFFETGGPTRKLASAIDSIEQSRWVIEHPAAIRGLGQTGGVR